MHRKFLDVPNGTMKELEVSELKKVSYQAFLFVAELSMFKKPTCVLQFLGAYQDAKIGFGSAYNIKTSIMRSLYECPFLAVGVKV